VSQTVWQKAGLLVTDVVNFVRVRGLSVGLLSVVISELCLDSCLRCKVSQTVLQKAGLLVADVVSFV